MISATLEKYHPLKVLKVAKVCCLASLLFFTRYFFKVRSGRKFVVNDHHDTICDTLERALKGELTKIIINVAPRYSKTDLAVKNFIAHGLALNPAAKFIHLSFSDELALDNSEAVKEIVVSEEYQKLFPHVQIKPGTDSKKKWYTTKGGGVYATSASGQVTGFGAGLVDEEQPEKEDEDIKEFLNDIEAKEGFGGAIIIDDPIKPEDAESDTIRERVNNRFESTIRSRVNSRKTPIIIIMQRLHEKDLCGYLEEIEPNDWHVVKLPAIKPDGSALWPFKHTIEELKKLKAANESVFDRQYMQDPTTKAGKLFPKDDLHFYNPATVDVEKLAEFRAGVIDPADEGGDDLSFPIGYLIGDKIYVTDWIYNNDGTDINEPDCVDRILTKKLNFVTVESNSAWILFTKSVNAKVTEKNPNCEIWAIKNTTNKHTRIWSEASFIRTNFVFRSDYADHPQYAKAMKNLLAYNKSQEGTSKNKHDDAPDSLAELAKYYKDNFNLW